MSTINRTLTLGKLTELSGDDLRWLVHHAKAEQVRRRVAHILERQHKQWAFTGLANFMAGVTWALACRATLRASKEHPPIGKGLASGEMWYPWEMVYAVRHEVAQRGWSPIGAKSAGDVVVKLLTESQRKDTSKTPAAVTFHIPFAQGHMAMYRNELTDEFGL